VKKKKQKKITAETQRHRGQKKKKQDFNAEIAESAEDKMDGLRPPKKAARSSYLSPLRSPRALR
jgi:hypothetical protein